VTCTDRPAPCADGYDGPPVGTCSGCADAVSTAHLLAQVLAHLDPQRTDLADALAALGAAVAEWRRRFARHAAARTLIGVFTGGRLLGPTPAD
jgi:hypothetical protein